MAYDGIYQWVRSKLRDSMIGIDDSELDLQIEMVLLEMLSPYPAVTYASLSATDKTLVDCAAGLRTAVRVHAELVTGGVSSSLTSEATDDIKRTFAPSDTMKAEWLAQARTALLGTTFAKGTGGTPRFAVNGPSRNRCQDYDRPLCDTPYEPCP